jgi:hypothetical protein
MVMPLRVAGVYFAAVRGGHFSPETVPFGWMPLCAARTKEPVPFGWMPLCAARTKEPFRPVP